MISNISHSVSDLLKISHCFDFLLNPRFLKFRPKVGMGICSSLGAFITHQTKCPITLFIGLFHLIKYHFIDLSHSDLVEYDLRDRLFS